MGVLATVGDQLMDLDELDEVAEKSELTSFIDNKSLDSSFTVPISGDRTLTGRDLSSAFNAASPTVPFRGVGLGKPLTIVLEHVYLGNYPDTMPWMPGTNDGDVLVTSALKGFEIFDAAPRAVHMLQRRPPRRKPIAQRATQKGSQLVFYSPAMTNISTILTLEMAVDRDFDDEMGTKLGQAFTTAGALPVFAPAAPYLIAAGVAIPLGVKAANLLARPRTFFEANLHIDFDRPGSMITQEGAFVVFPDDHAADFNGFTLDKTEFVLKDADNKPYRGDTAYMVVSYDGTERPQFKNWKAEAATAALTEQFFGGEGSLTKAIEIVSGGLGLYNDMEFRRKAVEAKAKSKELTGDAKRKQLELFEAYKSNIQNDDLKSGLA